MTKTWVIASTLPVLFLQCTTASRQGSDETQGSAVEAEVVAAEKERHDALVRSDIAVLDRLYDDEYIAIHNTGTVRTKREVLRDFRQQRLPYESRNTRDLIVRVYGNAAVVTGLLLARLKDGRTTERRFVNVWVRRQGHWQLVVHQSTPVVSTP